MTTTKNAARTGQSSFFLRGDEYVYTGETRTIHGGKFYVGENRAGREAVTQTPPGGVSPYAEKHKAEWQAQQAQFAKLHSRLPKGYPISQGPLRLA